MGSATPRILVVDDEFSVVQDYLYILKVQQDEADDGFRSALEEELFGAANPRATFPDFNLVTCTQGDEAIDAVRDSLIEQQPFSVAFIDMHLPPGRDGLRTAECIRRLDASIQIVAVTAYADIHPYDISDCVPPADKIFYLQKPFHAHEVQQLALALTARWQSERDQLRNSDSLLDGKSLVPALQPLPIGVIEFDRHDRLITANQKVAQMFPELAEVLMAGISYEKIFEEMALTLLPEDTLYRTDVWLRNHMEWHRKLGEFKEYRLRGPVWIMFLEGTTPAGETNCLLLDVTELRSHEYQRVVADRMACVAGVVGKMCQRLGERKVYAEDIRPAIENTTIGEARKEKRARRRNKADRVLGERLDAIAQTQKLNSEILDVGQIIRDLGRVEKKRSYSSIEVGVVADAGLWAMVADKEKLERALSELVKNAREAMGGGGQLFLEAANERLTREFIGANGELTPGDYVRLSVRDNGPGMSPGLAERAMYPFFTSKASEGHAGLGLSAAYGFARQSGAHLKVNTWDGGGVSVDLYFRRGGVPEDIGVGTVLLRDDAAYYHRKRNDAMLPQARPNKKNGRWAAVNRAVNEE